jgi:XRE family transcriptional regulator, regulator of sulfur utilization
MLMMTRRDLIIATVAVGVTFFGSRWASSKDQIMGSSAFDWTQVPAVQEDGHTVRHFFRAPTATLNELEVHVTTLPAGEQSHPAHKHPNEELVIVKEGTVEVLVNGEMRTVGPGSVIFNGSNQMHSLRNVGKGPATYHVVNWKSTATPSQ